MENKRFLEKYSYEWYDKLSKNDLYKEYVKLSDYYDL